MAQITSESRWCDAESLRSFSAQLLVYKGLAGADAETVADSLVEINLRGIDSHGIARLPHYLQRLRHGSIEPQPQMALHRHTPSTATLDGGHGLGQLVMARATTEAIEMARAAGPSWVSVKNSSHCGALSYYGLRIAASGMIGFAFTHVDPMVLPHGASEPFCGINPICITAPGSNGRDLCLDMATSVTPWNSVANAAMEGVAIPAGWGVDPRGNDTIDPRQVHALYPVGGHKGAGLGILIDVLCSMLGGSPSALDIPKMYGDLTQRRLLGGLVGAIDIKRFVPLSQFQSRIEASITTLGALRPEQPGGMVMFPGEPELRSRERRLTEGLPLGVALIKEMNGLAQQWNLPMLSTRPAPLDRAEALEIVVAADLVDARSRVDGPRQAGVLRIPQCQSPARPRSRCPCSTS